MFCINGNPLIHPPSNIPPLSEGVEAIHPPPIHPPNFLKKQYSYKVTLNHFFVQKSNQIRVLDGPGAMFYVRRAKYACLCEDILTLDVDFD